MEDLTSAEMAQLRERWVKLRPDEQGRYMWDRWESQALSLGVNPGLASLGREVILRSDQHEDGDAMLELARRAPATALERWTELLSRPV